MQEDVLGREALGRTGEWLLLRRGIEAGHPPVVDLDHERRLVALLGRAVERGLIRSAHDVSDGGLALALTECSISGPGRIGAKIALSDTIRPDALLFGESTGRVIATTAEPEALRALAAEAGVPAQRIGETGGSRLRIGAPMGDPWIDTAVDRLHEIWSRAIPRRLEAS